MLLQLAAVLVEENMAQVRNLLNLEPPSLFLEVESALRRSLGPADPAKQADHVLRLSNHYVSSPESLSPWSHAWAMKALLSYYHPLNQSRAFGVANRGLQRGFFEGLSTIHDFGCGTGAAALGMLAAWPEFKKVVLSDHSSEVLKTAHTLFSEVPLLSKDGVKWDTKAETLETSSPPESPKTSLALFSYVLTEAGAIDRFERFLKRGAQRSFEAIVILEPSTSADGRRLQRLRSVLLENDYHIWAPCTHSDKCPLLEESDRDWCHDRFPPFLPSWWKNLEAGLPMKNQSITVSYLLARKKPLPSETKFVRVTGDPLHEKTKMRQLICRGPHREFISWFPSRFAKPAAKELKNFDLARGDLFKDDPKFWQDQRGAERGHEYRLGENEIFQIRDSLEELAIKLSK
ncbi:MAG: small ribosomal subunit Rsm22 family protein [Bdellovibrionales bacterium]|nr:small ribosomal subunit Rsm22 family protein [Bdellovibrionales bacterium]